MNEKVTKLSFLTLFLFWLINSLTILLTSLLVPDMLVIGNAFVTMREAIILGGLILALGAVVLELSLMRVKIHIGKHSGWGLIFLVYNIIAIWTMGRFAKETGIGVANLFVVLLLGVTITLLEWGVWLVIRDKLARLS